MMIITISLAQYSNNLLEITFRCIQLYANLITFFVDVDFKAIALKIAKQAAAACSGSRIAIS